MKNPPSFAKTFLYSIHQMYVLVQKHMEKKLADAKTISFSQFWVLVCFLDCKDETQQVASLVAKKMHITEATLSRHIERLLKQKLIKKNKDEKNGRKFIIHLTDKGKDEYLKSKDIIQSELDKIFNVVVEKDRKNVLENFEKVLNKLKAIK